MERREIRPGKGQKRGKAIRWAREGEERVRVSIEKGWDGKWEERYIA